MTNESKQPKAEQLPTEYLSIDPSHAEFVGTFDCEILDEMSGPSFHLAISPEKRLSKHGKGDVVITGISRKGYEEIQKVLGGLGPQATMADVKRALTALSFITWDKPWTGK